MPTYEYACKSCGEHLEVVQSFRDDALTECPACGGPLRKVFSAAGLIFKGSGWHINDYRTSGKPATSSSSGSGEGGSKSDSKSDSKSGDSGESSPKPSPKTDTASSSGETKSA